MAATVKSEPTAGSGVDTPVSPSTTITEDDDGGELNLANLSTNAWLMRVPVSLWTALDGMADEETVQVGKMRVWEDSGKIKAMRLLLDDNISQLEGEPKRYNLTVDEAGDRSKSLYVFTEKDSGEFKPVSSFATFKMEKNGKPDYKKGRFRGRQFRKSITRGTSLVATIGKVVNCHAVNDADLQLIKDQRRLQLEAIETARNTVIGGTGPSGGVGGPPNLHGFITTAPPTKAAKPQDNKFTRKPQDQLLDEIGKCFQQFKYWRLKSLKQELRQPEAYLKETLQKIAVLVKTGPFANTWTLTPTMSKTLIGDGKSRDEAAPDQGAGDGDDSDGDGDGDDGDVDADGDGGTA